MSTSVEKISQAFGAVAHEYDAWYEDNLLFANELKAIKALGPWERPALEVGVGTGRFATALEIEFGLDPTFEMLALARNRGIRCVCGLAEALPFRDQSLATVAFFFTLCFILQKKAALKEAFRVLKVGGRVLLGMVPRESSWGQFYTQKGQKGHPLYRFAQFLTLDEALALAKEVGFSLGRSSSILFFKPEESPRPESPRSGLASEAGFVVLELIKKAS